MRKLCPLLSVLFLSGCESVMDGTNPLYLPIGIVILIYIIMFSIKDDKKHIEKGDGDITSYTTWYGIPVSYKESYKGGKYGLIIFIVTLIIMILIGLFD
tara:strand:- start:182 stop:478 length:297 start_codon:yes stop_codon:yes gene_type:complete